MAEERQSHGVTNALINAKLDTVIEKLADFRQELEGQEQRVRVLELAFGRLEPTIKLLSRVSAVLGGLIVALLFKMLTGEASVSFP